MNIYKVLRASKNLTQSQLAKQLNITQSAVSRWEKDLSIPDIETLKILAKFYDVTVDYLVTNSQNFTQPLQKQKVEEEQKQYSNEQQQVINMLLALNQTNFIKAFSYISGLYAAQT